MNVTVSTKHSNIRNLKVSGLALGQGVNHHKIRTDVAVFLFHKDDGVHRMNGSTALAFLRQNQPLPSGEELTHEIIMEYEAVREYFIEHPDPACIPLFLNSFGGNAASWIYQMVDEVLWPYPPEQVLPHLLQSLRSPHRNIRFWSAEIAASFPSPALIEPLQELLLSSDEDMRAIAAIALSQIVDKRVDAILQEALEREEDSDIREILSDNLDHRRKQAMN